GIGGHSIGNFAAFDFERSGRFLDPPEFVVIHDRGLSAGLFDRLDYNPTTRDALHLNVFVSRNNFQVPNQFDQDAIGQDQHQLVRAANIAAGWVHTFNPSTLLTISPYYRLEQVWYFPSANPFSDQTQTISQQRRLTNAGISADLAYNKGRHNIRAGVQASHTFLTEAFQFGITDPGFNDPASPAFLPGLLPFDLTRGGHLFTFNGHTDIKQEAVYANDLVSLGNLALSLGLRFDNYNGIVKDNAIQPRLGASYLIKRTGTVLRGSYTRTFETPYNENLILSSATGAGGLAANGVLDTSTSAQPLRPGRRNQYNAGLQQGFGKYIVIDGDYFWKYTGNGYDFNALLNTPVTFPISWSRSKLDGVGVRASLNNYKGLSVYFTAGHTRSRYFPPETGGLFFNSNLPAGVFRIDHDQAFQQTTSIVYQFNQLKKLAPYVTFSWKYDSGLVAGSVPDFATALTLTPDQQAQIGLFCGSTFATPEQGLSSCSDPNHGALRVRIPADGTENDDTNPPRIAPRHLFDASIGTDNLFRTEHTRVTLRFSGVNLTNKVALYNFLSTFSGTHFVTPRVLSAQLGIIF
ncbi:MAG TPA: TonB-dependent receptor, partial [Blastocatellia bacterium]|nr:TonB-dependent receptor [Blastocatellia bacterium]